MQEIVKVQLGLQLDSRSELALHPGDMATVHVGNREETEAGPLQWVRTNFTLHEELWLCSWGGPAKGLGG